MQDEKLIELALLSQKNAYAPYSNFHVGAALLAKSGKVYTGCNIESAAYSPTNCAERTALFKAVSEGERQFSAIAIVGAKNGVNTNGKPCAPCGVCRQMLFEFCNENLVVLMANSKSDYIKTTLGELLPFAFGPNNLSD